MLLPDGVRALKVEGGGCVGRAGVETAAVHLQPATVRHVGTDQRIVHTTLNGAAIRDEGRGREVFD